VKIWIDIENPPQVQYLLPLRRAFERDGAEVVITARDYESTVQMLQRAGVTPAVFGTRVGRSKVRKAMAVASRTRNLLRFFKRQGAPDAVVTASRAAPLVAWRLGIPSFLIGDYEHTGGTVSKFTGATILYPDVIDPSILLARGLRPEQLLAFKGLKEDLTFAEVDLDAIEPYDLGPVPNGAVRVLFRPPAETSHYYSEASSNMARAALEHLAGTDAVVVFSPRLRTQVALLDGLPWRQPPVVLERPVPFVSLLKSVDAVVCSGGTMLREAAYLGIPAYSIFQSEIGAVDRWLEEIGRAKLLTRPDELSLIELKARGPLARLNSNPHLLDGIVEIVTSSAKHDLKVPREKGFALLADG
jgi:predicted glycosyltransferase